MKLFPFAALPILALASLLSLCSAHPFSFWKSGAAPTPAPFTDPSSISGLVLWLKADALALADGTAVSSWTDSSGLSNHATQATGTKQPIFKTGILNGKAVLRFDASDDGLVTALAVASPFSVFTVYNCSTTSGQRRAIQGASPSNWLIGPYSGAHKLYNGSFINGPAITAGVFVRAAALVDASGSTFRVNAATIGSNTSAQGIGTLTLAASGYFVEPLAGDIAEVVVYNRKLTTEETTSIEGWLATKYAL